MGSRSPVIVNNPILNLIRNLSKLRVSTFPVQTRLFKLFPPLTSGLVKVLADASHTGLAGVVTESEKAILQGIKYCTSFDRNKALIERPLIKIRSWSTGSVRYVRLK